MNQRNYQKELDRTLETIQREDRVPRLLLHCCCAPCSSYVLEYLSRYFQITVLYYNPNIYPPSEYEMRVEEEEKLIEKKNRIYVDYIKTMTPDDILPGILPFIGHAKKAGLKLAVASVSKNAGALLSALGIADQFDYIADAAKIKKSKPDPEIFLDCAQGLRVEPENCVGIEDAQAGIEAIKAAGMQAIGIHVTITSQEPDIHLQSTEELDFEQMIR